MAAKDQQKLIVYDRDLNIEAYYFNELKQSFPTHSHDFYVIGLSERGQRELVCNKKTYVLEEGCFLLLNPEDQHDCVPNHPEGNIVYRTFHIQPEVMQNIYEIEKEGVPPFFDAHVVNDQELRETFVELHDMIMGRQATSNKQAKTEKFSKFVRLLIDKYGKFKVVSPQYSPDVQLFAKILQKNYNTTITIDTLCERAGLGRRHIFRLFIRELGITPHRYILTLRMREARRLLEQGLSSSSIAVELGFVDQAHFIRSFSSLTGITPKEYTKFILKRD